MFISKKNPENKTVSVIVFKGLEKDIPAGWSRINRELVRKPVFSDGVKNSNELPTEMKNLDPFAGLKTAATLAEIKSEIIKILER